MKVRFEKWEGLGNDFVVLRDLPRPLHDEEVRAICDRRFGVGGDGILFVETRSTMGLRPAEPGSAPNPADIPRMIVRNADGSRPEMCGNGLRCVAGHLLGAREAARLVVATDAGDKACEARATGEDRVEVVVDMGVARPGPDLVVVVGGREHRFLTVDMGNPHAVSFADHAEGAFQVLGPEVARTPPGGTNVELCRVLGDRIEVAVWERGVGPTLACGTGACAVAVAACETGRASFGVPIRVALPGGLLEITVAQGSRAVQMRGPARRVFSGEVVIA
jgi:diaminopimelate epimerase